MKKVNNDILRYLSGLMNQREIKFFEERLKSSKDFKREYDATILKMKEISNVKDTQTDERYFNDLLPKIRIKLEKEESSYSFRNIYYVVPAAALIIIAIFLLPKSSSVLQDQHQVVAQEVMNHLSDEDVAEKYFYEYYLESRITFINDVQNNFSMGIPDNVDITKGDYINTLDLALLDDFTGFERISDEDLETAYNKLSAIKLQKVTK